MLLVSCEGEGVDDGAEDIEVFGQVAWKGVERVHEARWRFDVVGGDGAGG